MKSLLFAIIELQGHRLCSANIWTRSRSTNRIHSARSMGRFRSTTDCWGFICRCQHIFGDKTGSLVFNKSALGTVANFVRAYGYRYCEILLHLLTRPACICLWIEPAVMVLCGFGKDKMLPQTKWNGWLGKSGRCLYEVATFWKVNAKFRQKSIENIAKMVWIIAKIILILCLQPIWIVAISVLGQFWDG